MFNRGKRMVRIIQENKEMYLTDDRLRRIENRMLIVAILITISSSVFIYYIYTLLLGYN